MRSGKATPYVLLLPCIILLTGLYAYPILLTCWQSFHKINIFTNQSSFIGLENFRHVFTRDTFWTTLEITAKYTFFTVLFKLFFGFGVAFLLHGEVFFKKFWGLLILIPWAIPQVAAGTIWQWLLNVDYGYINYYLLKFHLIAEPIAFLSKPTTAFFSTSLVDTWMGIPMLVMIFLAALESVPKNLYEAAAMDGAGPLRQFIDVTMPGIKKIFLTVTTLVTIWTFNSFNVIYVLTQGGPIRATETLIIRIYQEAFSRFDLGVSAALTVIAVIILIILSSIYIVGGRSREEI